MSNISKDFEGGPSKEYFQQKHGVLGGLDLVARLVNFVGEFLTW